LGASPLLTTSVFFQGFFDIAKVVIIHNNMSKKWLPSQGNMLANLAIKIWNKNLQSSFYISSYLLNCFFRNSGDLFFFGRGSFLVIGTFQNTLHSIYFFVSTFRWYFANLKIRLLIIVTMGYYLPHFLKKRRIFAYLTRNCFLGNFWMNVIF